jgi:ketosteroid isomerase-like protein
MSEENVEIVRRGFEILNRGGPEALWSGGLWSPEIVWDTSPSGIPGLGVYRGYDEVRSAFEDNWFTAFPFEEWEIAVEELIDHGDQVIAMSRQRGRGASSGVAAELEQAHVFTLRDGKIVRIDSYLDRKKALEAAGLSE